MGVNLQSALLLYGAGSFMGTVSYLAIVICQQLMGSSLERLFFSLDYEELMINACYSGIWALIFMFVPYQKYRNLLIAILPGLTYLTQTKGGFNTVLTKLDLGLFVNYETLLILVIFCVLWGLGIPKILKQGE